VGSCRIAFDVALRPMIADDVWLFE